MEVSQKGRETEGLVRNRCLQLKFVPPGPANLAPKPVVIQTGDLRNGISFPTTVVRISYPDIRSEEGSILCSPGWMEGTI